MAKHPIDEGVVNRLVKLLDEHGLTELEYGERHWHVRVSRAAVAAPAGPAGPAPSAEADEQESSAAESAANHPGAVTSPMVGTVYLAPEPGADAFVKIGETVAEGQTLLLIEAMKTMNPIQAHQSGKVTQIFAQNATPVEYGEVLVIIE
ncbi:MAG: acetyl-CoA carboxylase biotin carboxyl carrier protein [Alphaproteobacteria bacterium]|nr:acetyl-CoA carboxylase biotin carboxyl carrier protein [Alphaproteobacteria bacterium]